MIEKLEISESIAIVKSDDGVPALTDAQSALDLLATAKYEWGIERLVFDRGSVADSFFELRTGIAGEILQKFVNYHVRAAFVGDFAAIESKSLRDFIRECNRGEHFYFVASLDEAIERLG